MYIIIGWKIHQIHVVVLQLATFYLPKGMYMYLHVLFSVFSASMNSQGKETKLPERRQYQSRQTDPTRRRGGLNTPKASNLP